MQNTAQIAAGSDTSAQAAIIVSSGFVLKAAPTPVGVRCRRCKKVSHPRF